MDTKLHTESVTKPSDTNDLEKILQQLDAELDFTERFVRGDASRTDGGSGLGLSIARSFTEACGGRLRIKVDADLFTAEVTFPSERA